MAEFLTTKDVASRVEQLVRKAKKRIILISPFIRCWDTLYYRLLEAGKKGVEVVVIYGKKISKPERIRLQVIPNMKLYSLEELHAKCSFILNIIIMRWALLWGRMNLHISKLFMRLRQSGILLN